MIAWVFFALLASQSVHAGKGVSPYFNEKLASSAKEIVTVENSVELLVNGPEFYPARLDLIRGAKKTIELTTFLWADDEAGLEVAKALAEAKTKRDVRVRIIVDEYNGKPHQKAYQMLKDAGVYLYKGPGTYETSLNLHIHEKVMVVDGDAALIGGANLCDEYMIGGERGLWHDLEVLARGPVAARAQKRFDELWDWLAEGEFRARSGYDDLLTGDRDTQRIYPIFGPTKVEPSTPGRARALLEWQQSYMNGGDSKRFKEHFTELLKSARRSVVLYAPYAIFQKKFYRALLETARRPGVSVKLYTNSRETNDMQEFIALAPVHDYPALMKAGIEIYEMTERTLHAKAVLIDDEVVSIGSHNFTARSFNFNGEANVLTDDPAAVERFRSLVGPDLAAARRVDEGFVEAMKRKFKNRFNIRFGDWVRGLL